MSTFRTQMLCAGAVALVLFTSAGASAQLRIREATAMLDSTDRDEVNMGLEAMAGLGSRAARPLIARIHAGLPTPLLESALSSLGALERPEAAETFIAHLRHRSVEIRLAALRGLVALRPRDTAPIALALNDGEPQVRGAAAIALGSLGARTHVDRLFVALDRRVLEAAQAIGQLARGAELERFFSYLGRLSFDTLTPAFQEVFARDDVPAATKIALIHRLGELATPGVRDYLMDLTSSLPAGEIQNAAQDASEGIQ